jgi:hypothetical protein
VTTVTARKPASSKIGALRTLLFELLQEHERDGAIPTNARFLYYELIQRGQISKVRTGVRRTDQDLHDALTDIREDRRIPWDWIIDETRSVDDYTGYQTVKQGLLARLPYTNLDPWRGRAPLILCESRSLAGVLRPIIIEHCNRIAPTNGQCGGFLRTDVAPLLQPGDTVGYLGDYDLAGGQIEANTRRVLEREIGGELHWERIALTAEQVEQYDLPKIVKRDRRCTDGHPHEALGAYVHSYEGEDEEPDCLMTRFAGSVANVIAKVPSIRVAVAAALASKQDTDP